MTSAFDHEHIWDSLVNVNSSWQETPSGWEWCIVCGTVRRNGSLRHPLASLERPQMASNPDPHPPTDMSDTRSVSSVRAPIKAVASPEPAIRRDQYLTRARFHFRDTKGKDYQPKQSELDAFVDGLERQYQRSLTPLVEEMDCTCPWLWPKLTGTDEIHHHESCPMLGMNRLGTKQYFDNMHGKYYGNTGPRT